MSEFAAAPEPNGIVSSGTTAGLPVTDIEHQVREVELNEAAGAVETGFTDSEGGGEKEAVADDVESEDGPTSSIDNVIPVDNLLHGWAAVRSFVRSGCAKIQEKTIEAYNSEQVQNLKRRTSEVVTPAWEKTVESTTYAVEKAKENVASAQEKLQPTLVEVQARAAVGWEQFSTGCNSVAKSTVEQTKAFVATVTTEFNTQTEGYFTPGGTSGGGDDGGDSAAGGGGGSQPNSGPMTL